MPPTFAPLTRDEMRLHLAVLEQEPQSRPVSSRWRLWRSSVERIARALPIGWRILTLAALNIGVVLILAALIWNGAKVLNSAWDEVRQVRDSDRLLALLESEAGRLQSLIHRYINQPSPEIFAEILLLREAVLGTLRTRGSTDPMLSGSVDKLVDLTVRFLDGFGDLRTEQSVITETYETEVLRPANEMGTLFSALDGALRRREGPLASHLTASREAFTQMLTAANAYYVLPASNDASVARRNLITVEQSIRAMVDLAEHDIQRAALTRLAEQATNLRRGLDKLADLFANRAVILRTAIDGNQAAMVGMIDDLSKQMQDREQQAQKRFDQTLFDIYRKIAIVAGLFLLAIVIGSAVIGQSITAPLRELMRATRSIVAGSYQKQVQGTEARDEIGDMARSVEVFRENAIAKRQAEEALRAAKESAEAALAELRETQQSLIEAEKLAALGGLVAGVAHEVNNPVGISLTVASSFARRCQIFADEIKDGTIRKSKLDEFIALNLDAAQQLVANLQRAGDLIQSFKQVAVDRSHEDRRSFDLHEATQQIITSLRPVLRKSAISLSVDGAPGVVMDSYPGAYGQVLTNLFLNAVVHAFPEGGANNRVIISTRALTDREVEIIVADNGRGMSDEVQKRAFDPFFTTRRDQGGTGLGLHIIYTLVRQRLGGALSLDTQVGRGTVFRITLPRAAPRDTEQDRGATA
jgi:signal transduction histidine kinase